MIHQKSLTSWSSLYSYRAHNQQIQLKTKPYNRSWVKEGKGDQKVRVKSEKQKAVSYFSDLQLQLPRCITSNILAQNG